MRRFFSSDSGQTIVEVALVAPLLFLLVAGAIDLGRSAQFDMRLASTARAAAQYGSQNLITAADYTGMSTAGTNDGHSWSGVTLNVTGSNFCKCADGSNASCTANACSSNHRLVYVTVTSTANFKPLFNYFFGTTQARSKTVVLQVAQ
jgi:Flp pilus assembly protein TadG